MTDLTELTRQRAEIEAQIAEMKVGAIAHLHEQMRALGITAADLGPVRTAAPKTTRPAKYRDEHGNTWSGVGKRPTWLRTALLGGATLDQFKVK